MKRILLILILGTALILSACTGGKEESGKPEGTGNDSKFAQTSTTSQDSQKEESNSQTSQSESSSGEESSKPEESSSHSNLPDPSSKPEESSKTESSKPEESSSKPEESSSKPEESSKEESSDDIPVWLKEATESQIKTYYAAMVRYTNDYYSYQGLIDSLYYYDGYDYDDAEWAVGHIVADWYSEALGYANYQLNNSSYSPLTLRDDLDIAGFKEDEIDYALENCTADWDQEAAEAAGDYARQTVGSRREVHDFLINIGFDESQANYGLANCGIDWYEQAVTYANKYAYMHSPVPLYSVKMQFLDGDWESEEIEYALANVNADFNEMALERAHEITDDYNASEEFVRYALMNEMYVGEEIEYAIANIGIEWNLEAAAEAVWYVEANPSWTHDELRAHLINDAWFTEEQADYGCYYVEVIDPH
ncbi:MAG: RecX family transcriptional regulator [Firmicutes bacterium]|nr:RecX family transcriptional regulator [Bacillota bacterium]